jgi:hypothetical protein
MVHAAGTKRNTLAHTIPPKKAAQVFDRAVVQHELPSSKFNYPGGLPVDVVDDYRRNSYPKKKRERRENR